MKSAQGKVPEAFYTALYADADKLGADPTNETLRKSIFTRQILATSTELGITTAQAGDVVRSFTSSYASAKGYDKQQILDGLSSDIQRMLNYDRNQPKFAGMDIATANALASYLTVAGGVLLPIAAVLFIVGMLMVGIEATAAALAAGSVAEALIAALQAARGTQGFIYLVGGGMAWAVLEGLKWFATTIPVVTKQLMDNGSIVPTMQIQGIKNALEIERELTGGNQIGPYSAAQVGALLNGFKAAGVTKIKNPATNTVDDLTQQSLGAVINVLYGDLISKGQPATPSKITPLLNAWLISPSGSVSLPYPIATGTSTPVAQPAPVKTQVFTGVVANGVLGTPKTFESVGDGLITSDDDLKETAAQTLANFVLGLPAQFHYEIAIVSSFRTPAGFTLRGERVNIVSGYNKNGTPRYKTVYKKFAVLKVYLFDRNGRKVNLLEENMGEVNATDYVPSEAALSGVSASLTPSIFTTDVEKISGIVSNAPVTVASPAPVSQPAPVVTPPPAPAPVAPAYTPATAQTLALNDAFGVPFSYGSMGSGSWDALAAKYGVSVADINAVNPDWKNYGGINAGGVIDISIMMRNYGRNTVNIPTQRQNSTPAPAPVAPAPVYTPQPAPAPAPVATTPPIVPVIAYQYKVNTPGSTLNVRSAPGTSASIIDSLANGAYIKTGSPMVQKDGYNWFYVTYDSTSGGKTGYVASEYLTKL